MNKINICENFKNENLPLIFNINYEGFSKYNKNETYINIYNRFFNSISENESLYEIIKCIITFIQNVFIYVTYCFYCSCNIKFYRMFMVHCL